jgi:hypothetical protein
MTKLTNVRRQFDHSRVRTKNVFTCNQLFRSDLRLNAFRQLRDLLDRPFLTFQGEENVVRVSESGEMLKG